MRLRQAVLVAAELQPAIEALRTSLGLEEPFRDPGVATFGLANAVFALGDCFLEVVSPTRAGGPDTAAGRYLERHGGDGGYMVIFDVEDDDGPRERIAQLGIRIVWEIALPDISTVHLHPADMRGAIVSIDRSQPYGTWRWGGPDWTGRRGKGAAARLAGVTLAVAEEDPAAVAARWAEVLGRDAHEGSLRLDSGEVAFMAASARSDEGLCEIAIALPADARAGREAIDFGSARLRLLDETDAARDVSSSTVGGAN